MESEFQELIERLVGDVALTGTYGMASLNVTHVECIDFIECSDITIEGVCGWFVSCSLY